MTDIRRRKTIRRRWMLATPILGLGIWLAAAAVSYASNHRIYAIPTASTSMSPTLAPGDRIAVETRPGLIPERGEVWVFDLRQNMTLAKRAIGLPGETIEVANGRVLIDGKPLDEPYLSRPIAYTMAPVRLGSDEFFMLGDNRDASHDSHIWGPLPRAQLVGRSRYLVLYPPRQRTAGSRHVDHSEPSSTKLAHDQSDPCPQTCRRYRPGGSCELGGESRSVSV